MKESKKARIERQALVYSQMMRFRSRVVNLE